MSAEALETRTCECGCGGTFRCLPTSKQRFRSSFCDPSPTLRIVGRGRRKETPERVVAAREAAGIPDVKPDLRKEIEALPEGVVTTKMLMEELGRSYSWVCQAARMGKIPVFRRGRGKGQESWFVLEDVKAAIHDAKPLPPMKSERQVIAETTTISDDSDSPRGGGASLPMADSESAASPAPKPKLGRIYLREARAAQRRKERQAERVLLWLAIEAFGLEERV